MTSPFEDDRKFALTYVSYLSRDYVNESERVLNALFYDKIYDVLMKQSADDTNRFKALDILCNMTQSDV